MRNILEHKITRQEIYNCLEKFLAEVDPSFTGFVGDMRPTLLEIAMRIINQTNFDKVDFGNYDCYIDKKTG